MDGDSGAALLPTHPSVRLNLSWRLVPPIPSLGIGEQLQRAIRSPLPNTAAPIPLSSSHTLTAFPKEFLPLSHSTSARGSPPFPSSTPTSPSARTAPSRASTGATAPHPAPSSVAASGEWGLWGSFPNGFGLGEGDLRLFSLLIPCGSR